MKIPASRATVDGLTVHKRNNAEDVREEAYTRGGAMTYPKTIGQRNDAEDLREETYTRGGAMTYPKAIDSRNNAEDFREETYTRGGAMTYPKTIEARSNAEDIREQTYTRGGAMTYPKTIDQRDNNAEDIREEAYTRGGAMTYPKTIDQRDNNAEDVREQTYTRGGAMTYPKTIDQRANNAEDIREETYTRGGAMTYPKTINQRRDDVYSALLDRNNLALGAVERINIAHRVLGKPEITMQEANETASHSDEYVDGYWQSSMKHGDFWTTDQPAGKPNFVEGGQSNGFGFTQSTYHKLHCLANLRMMLAWHITGNGDKMTRDMNVHAMHCLVSSLGTNSARDICLHSR